MRTVPIRTRNPYASLYVPVRIGSRHEWRMSIRTVPIRIRPLIRGKSSGAFWHPRTLASVEPAQRGQGCPARTGEQRELTGSGWEVLVGLADSGRDGGGTGGWGLAQGTGCRDGIPDP